MPLGLAEGRVLVIAPNLTIKHGLYEAMDITNRQKCFWRKRLATVVLNHIELTPAGTELIYKYKSLKLSGHSNFIAALTMVNHEINKRLGKDRRTASIEEFRSVLNNLEDLIQTLAKRVRKAKSDYDKKNS